MGLEILPDELLMSLSERWPCRDGALRQLSALLSISPALLVAYGPRATGKSGLIKSFLDASKLRHATVRSQEYVTGRHLLESIVAAVHAGTTDRESNGGTRTHPGRCENISSLIVHLQKMLQSRGKFVLVLDGIDEQRDAPPTLLPALGRLGEIVPHLTLIMIVRHPSPRFLHQGGIPHIHFGPYSRAQSVHIVARKPLDIFLEPPTDELDYDDETHEEDKAWLWPKFCAAIWDSFAQSAVRDLVAYRDLCHKLWRPFVAPVIKGDFGTRDFSRLLVAQRRLLQDEGALLHSIVSKSEGTTIISKNKTHELPYYAKWTLVAAYLASFNPARLDALYFMKTTEKKRRKKGGGTAKSGGRPSQKRQIPRHLLAASAFTIERLLAILHAILPDECELAA
ncbi:Putative origin recognition complex, subunit 5, P-loop containing nucleoside triphosphate hydrolase [Septoria linicola]|uniref:Origin recognition complex, subunit 5, P-loop containing nucleoside triphosphate hydrolase n=1 Tax=Septoria linicola TaxID=215465 RepID=A0A9Q9AWA9_9PEZI|nr:putative origin recognition complex, subunit 5, P-loop containing nucleoside triphosphate hydrolase [Septoria linicola]USW53001.1 Putative origin recognition complex, subunit 5, P-loop containing nucleoside triphosphate hydrolase [Septoria linicola]